MISSQPTNIYQQNLHLHKNIPCNPTDTTTAPSLLVSSGIQPKFRAKHSYPASSNIQNYIQI